MENNTSPLQKYQRQPKLYIDLPSQGVWYNENVVTKYKDLEVYSMTANDEISIKTPDALFSGMTVKTIIENCVPSIKDAWHINSIDLDYILAAIRLASYGDSITIEKKCTKCDNEDQYAIPVQPMLDHLQNTKPIFDIEVEGFKIHIRPLTYKEIVENNQSNMHVSRSLRQVLKSFADDDPKQGEHVEKMYDELNQRTKEVVCRVITMITTPDGDNEQNQQFIRDFILNGEPAFYNTIQERFIKNNDLLTLPPTKVECSECGAESDVKTELDYSNFFSKT